MKPAQTKFKDKEDEREFELSLRIRLFILGAYVLLMVLAAALIFNVYQTKGFQQTLIDQSIKVLSARINREAEVLLNGLSELSKGFLTARESEEDVFAIKDLFYYYKDSEGLISADLYRVRDGMVFGTAGDNFLFDIAHPDLRGYETMDAQNRVLRKEEEGVLYLARFFEAQSYWEQERVEYVTVVAIDLSPLQREIAAQNEIANAYVESQMTRAIVVTVFILLAGILMLFFLRKAILIAIAENFRVWRERQQMERLADTDALTGLYSVRKYQELLADSFNSFRTYGVPLSLIYFDVDHFKDVNDNYGHKAGDMVLEIIAVVSRACAENLGHADCFRIGGDEFVILVYDRLDHAVVLANAVRDEIKAFSFDTYKPPFKITISMGVAEADESLKVPHDLQVKSDRCLYTVKEEGRDGISTVPIEERRAEEDRRRQDRRNTERRQDPRRDGE